MKSYNQFKVKISLTQVCASLPKMLLVLRLCHLRQLSALGREICAPYQDPADKHHEQQSALSAKMKEVNFLKYRSDHVIPQL